MSNFLGNIFTKGTQALLVAGKLVKIPVNEDYCAIAEIAAYTPPKLSLKKAWDQATAKTVFHAEARFLGNEGVPAEADFCAGEFVPFHRVGIGNIDFAGIPTGFQKKDAEATTKSSFVVFARPSLPAFGIPALVAGPENFSRQDYSNSVNTYLAAAQGWQETDLKRIADYKIFDRDSGAIKVSGVDSRKVLIRKGDSISYFRNTVLDCESAVQSDKVFRLDLAPAILCASEEAWCIDNLGDLALDMLCCEEQDPCSPTITVETESCGGFAIPYWGVWQGCCRWYSYQYEPPDIYKYWTLQWNLSPAKYTLHIEDMYGSWHAWYNGGSVAHEPNGTYTYDSGHDCGEVVVSGGWDNL